MKESLETKRLRELSKEDAARDRKREDTPSKNLNKKTTRTRGKTISNFADLPNLLGTETPAVATAVVEPQPIAKMEPEKTPAKKPEEKKKNFEHKKPTVLERIFDSLSEESRKFISGQIGKMRTEDKNTKGVLGLQQDPVRYIREALTQSRSIPEKILLEKIQRDLKKSLSKNQKSNLALEPKAVSEPLAKTVEPEKIPEPEVDQNSLIEPAVLEVTAAAEENLQDKKEKAVAELREIISKANQRLIEIEKELADIRARRIARGIAEKEARKREEIEKEKTIKKPETQTFPKDFIKARISNLLETSGQVSNIQKLEVVGLAGEISIQIGVNASGFDIGVDATIGNSKDSITLKNYNIDANFLAKGTVKKKLTPYLDKIPELLKTYIEKETGKKVASMRIEDGELKVTF